MQQLMLSTRLLPAAGVLIGLGALPATSAGPAAAQGQAGQSNPMEVTTDTPAYCLYLLDRVSNLVRVAAEPIPPDVTDLTTEGHRMCAHGKTRSGIMRLRSALVMMEKAGGPASRGTASR